MWVTRANARFILFYLLLIVTPLSQAGDDLSNMVRVSGESNKKCVEYYTYQGTLYCSTKTLNSQSTTPHIISYETQNIAFDNRIWKAAWGKKSDNIMVV